VGSTPQYHPARHGRVAGGERRGLLGGGSIAGHVCASAALCSDWASDAGAHAPSGNTGRRHWRRAARGIHPSRVRNARGGLVDQIVPLEEIWGKSDATQLFESLTALPLRRRLAALSRSLMFRTACIEAGESIAHGASQLITTRQGRVSIETMAHHYGVSRQQFTRTFSAATGVTPKLFARLSRFQSVVHALLSSEASEWASVAPATGFFDQAHMINEFRDLAGASPTVFFQPHGLSADPRSVRPVGRPHEWPRIEI